MASRPSHNRRVVDRAGNRARHGALADFSRTTGLARVGVLNLLRDGMARVNAFGDIEHGAPTGLKFPEKRKPIDWRATQPKPAVGALTRALKHFGIVPSTLYLRLEKGLIVVDPLTREFVAAADAQPIPELKPATPLLADRREAIRDAIRDFIVANSPEAATVFAGYFMSAIKQALNAVARGAAQGRENHGKSSISTHSEGRADHLTERSDVLRSAE